MYANNQEINVNQEINANNQEINANNQEINAK